MQPIPATPVQRSSMGGHAVVVVLATSFSSLGFCTQRSKCSGGTLSPSRADNQVGSERSVVLKTEEKLFEVVDNQVNGLGIVVHHVVDALGGHLGVAILKA